MWWEWREGKGEKGQGESEMESEKGMSQTLGMEKERGWERTTLRKIVGEIKKDGMDKRMARGGEGG